MKIDLSSVIKVTGAEVKFDDTVGFGNAEFLGESYVFDAPLAVVGRIYNNGQSLTLDAHVKGKMKTQCARCLDTIEVDVEYDVYDLLSQRDDRTEADEDIIFFDGHEIELDDIIADNFLLNVSGRYLCSEDCLGLCPKCGQNLNEGECGCTRDVIDPRWQALADILNQQNDE